MDILPIVIIASLGMMGLFALSWRVMFGSRSSATKKTAKKGRSKLKVKVSVSSIRRRNEQFIAVSNALNKIPFYRLSKQKAEEINRKLQAKPDKDGAIRIAEEIHCESWAFIVLYTVIVLFLTWLYKPCVLLGIGILFIGKIPYTGLDESGVEEETMDEEFRKFYNTYYVQYTRVGASLKLVDVATSYKGVASPEMHSFISRIEIDTQSGDEYALKMMDRRYMSHPDVHRFCSIAALVSRGDGNADRIVASFQDELTRKSISRRRAVVLKRMEKIEKVQSALLYVVACSCMIITFIFMAMI